MLITIILLILQLSYWWLPLSKWNPRWPWCPIRGILVNFLLFIVISIRFLYFSLQWVQIEWFLWIYDGPHLDVIASIYRSRLPMIFVKIISSIKHVGENSRSRGTKVQNYWNMEKKFLRGLFFNNGLENMKNAFKNSLFKSWLDNEISESSW